MKHGQWIFNRVPKTKGYNKTSRLERQLADTLYQRAKISGAKKYTLNLPRGTTGNNVIRALLVQHFPYTWYVGTWYEVEKLPDKTRDLTIKLSVFRKLDKKNEEVRAKIKEIVKALGITDATSLIDRARLLAEYVAEHCKYAYEDDERDHEAWDCLVLGETICCGYSQGYKALCDYCDVSCKCVSSYDHMWNRVKIGGRWYNVDTTWLAQGLAKSRYLLTPDDVFYVDHMKYEKTEAYWKYEG